MSDISRDGSAQLLARPAPFALVACQRSGTHLLRTILNSNPYLAVIPEPFSRYPQPVTWPSFVRTLKDDQYPPTLPVDAMALLDRFIRAIEKDIHENSRSYGGAKPKLKAIGLDVKYDQLRCVTSLFLELRAAPILIDYFRSRKIRIVHLIRKNPVHTAISRILAGIRGVWHNYDGSAIQGQYQILADELFEEIKRSEEQREIFQHVAQDLPMLTCFYEDLIDDLRRIDEQQSLPKDTTVLRPLAEYLDVPNQFWHDRCMHKVINKPYSAIIRNYHELMRTLEKSEFSEFAATL